MDRWFVLGAFALSLLLTLLPGRAVISFLHKLKFGQHILEIGPRWHRAKQGTPTMGGFIFIPGVLAVSLIFVRDLKGLFVGCYALSCGIIGFLDDYIKVVKKKERQSWIKSIS